MSQEKPFSLYIHVPFCLHKCPYCDFNTYAVASIPEKGYLSALLAEIDFRAACDEWTGRPLQSIYFGGGTPSLLSSEAISSLISAACARFPLCADAEISIEANPGTLNYDYLRACRSAGINRLSLGAQSFNRDILRDLGRIHHPEQVEGAVSAARDAGFNNISLDLIYAVPGQNLELWKEDLVAALALKPEHLSMYGLTIEKSTPFYQAYKKKLLKLPDEDLVVSMIEHANLFLAQHGLERYEISNFAREGFEARHNMAYWNGDDYIGVGAGSHSFISSTPNPDSSGVYAQRWANFAPWEKYVSECSSNGQAESWRETIERPTAMFEFFFLGLRKIGGVNLNAFKERFGAEADSVYPALLEMLVEQGLASRENQNLSLTESGLMVADSVIENFADPDSITALQHSNQSRFSAPAASVKQALQNLGFYKIQEGLESLKNRAAELVARAGNEHYQDRLEALPSFIDPAPALRQRDCALAIDIGGTSTKVGLRYLDKFSSAVEWQLVFELDNDALKSNGKTPGSLSSFAAGIADRIAAAESSLAVQIPAIKSLGIVWSNALESRACERGITGLVTQRDKYQKGEWFTQDLQNGDDVGAAFVQAFSRAGMEIEALVVANDTPLTMKALSGAHAGMVASTGLNGTLVKRQGNTGKPGICNTEMGNRFTVPKELLGRADFIGNDKPADTMEFLLAGLFLPRLFTSYIVALAEEGLPELSAPASHLVSLGDAHWTEYSAEDLTLLVYDKSGFVKKHKDRFNYQAASIRTLSILAGELFSRGAKLAAVEAYATVLNQFSESKELTIALDSRLARENRMFHDTMKKTLNSLVPEANRLNLVLLKPCQVKNGSISVPMQGAANALDSI